MKNQLNYMKRTLFTLACMAALTTAQAQTEKGRWLVGAQVGNFSYSDQSNQRSFEGSLTPSAGYFVANGLVVGTGIPLGLTWAKYTTTDPTTSTFADAKLVSTRYGLAPFIRYYFGENKLKPYVGVAYSYSRTNANQNIPGTQSAKSKGHTSVLKPTIGVAYFITRNVALNAGLDYNIQTEESRYTQAASVSNFSSNSSTLSLGIGFQLFFGS
nr:outer membrane beta-barrel protein [Spirosoma oryzae]